MEPSSIASLTFASIFASLPVNGNVVSEPTVTTHISPAIAGQWEIDLNNATPTVSSKTTQASVTTHEKDSNLIAPNKLLNTASPENLEPKAHAKQCHELYNFKADNEMWAVSGKEKTYARYLVTYGEEGLPIIAIKTIYDNNEVDCSGNQVDQTGETLIAFLKHNDNKMQWCADPAGKDCFVSFNKILP